MSQTGTTSAAPPAQRAEQHGQDRPVTLTAQGGDRTEPNHGSSVLDKEAMGEQTESMTSWQKRNDIDPSKQIKLVQLAHMRYQHPDLELATKFFQDFGMHVVNRTDDKIWYRGYGKDQYVYFAQKGERKFLGGTYEVESMAELERAAQLEGAGKIEEMSDAPGGGHILTLTDPEGFPVNLMYGQQPAPVGELPEKIVYNDETNKPRVRRFNRFTPGPAAVHKLGHYGLCVQQFDKMVKWYTSTFNLVPTDFMYVPTGENGQTKDVAMFAHIDRGDDPVDHHTFFMNTNPTSHVHHASFEVHDYDTQHLGHQWLGKQGYKSVWGIGRHILGSQIFDYWWDVHGNMIEHYADGDLVNKDTPIGWGEAGDEGLAVWGPEVPKTFLD
ncbi:hypothetical protein MBLNU230_g6702t1 [Neophaeotheca triangularis]